MSDGGRESGRDCESRPKKSRACAEDNFSRAVCRIAVAQLCELVGFQCIQSSALDALSDIAIRYISDLGKTAQFHANVSGRTECNVFDIIQGLEDLGLSYGFPGASDIDHCLADSGVIHDITQYVNTAEEVPFPRPIPRYPIVRGAIHIPSFEQIRESSTSNHIPNWLPALPDPHTYIHTPVWNTRMADPKTDKIEHVRQRKKAERSLLNLQQRLTGSNIMTPIQPQHDNIIKGNQPKKAAEDINPFLVPPLKFGEKEVSHLISPAEPESRRNPVLETLAAPVVEAIKNSVLDSDNSENKGLPSKRPAVYFKFSIDKRTLTAPLCLSTRGGSVESTSWLLKDEGRDEKKRRAKLILKESMENTQELHQL